MLTYASQQRGGRWKSLDQDKLRKRAPISKPTCTTKEWYRFEREVRGVESTRAEVFSGRPRASVSQGGAAVSGDPGAVAVSGDPGRVTLLPTPAIRTRYLPR